MQTICKGKMAMSQRPKQAHEKSYPRLVERRSKAKDSRTSSRCIKLLGLYLMGLGYSQNSNGLEYLLAKQE